MSTYLSPFGTSHRQFRVLRNKGTEAPGTGKLDKHFEEGVYSCAGCEAPLYISKTKFKSGCGWPAFYDGLYAFDLLKFRGIESAYLHLSAIPGAINRHEDNTLGKSLIELTCAACGGHLGHVFKGEGFNTPSTFV